VAPVEGEVIGLLPEAAFERESDWMRQLNGFDPQAKILEHRLDAPLDWPGDEAGQDSGIKEESVFLQGRGFKNAKGRQA
jgi:hypothetical protein